MCRGQFACNSIEFRRHRASRITFAHDGFKEHRFDVPAVGIGIGERLLKAFNGIGFDGDQLVFMVFPAGQILGIGLLRRIGIQAGQFGAAVESALHGNAFDALAFVAATRVGHQFGVGIGDAASQRNRFRARVQGQEFVIRTAAAAVPDFGAQGLHHPQLGQAWRHDVGHDLWFGHGIDDGLGGVAEAEHAVTTGIMQHAAFECDDPGAAGGDGYIRVDGIIRVEIDEAGLGSIDLDLLVGVNQFRKLQSQLRIGLSGTTGCGQQIRILGR